MHVLHFDEMVLAEGVRLTSIRDPFDRIILATALAYNLKIVTKDFWMHDHYSKIVIW